jgi:hypothetical protein
MAVSKIVDLGPRGFDSLILPRALLRIPMPSGTAVAQQFAPTRWVSFVPTYTVRPRSNYGMFIGQKPNRIACKIKSK